MTAVQGRPRTWPRSLAACLRDCRGGVLVEFAFAVPIFLLIVLGCYDAARYVLINQKMDRAAATIADLVSQPETITQADLDNLFAAADEVMVPFDLAAEGRVIVTSISRAVGVNDPVINWQRLDDSALSVSSTLGSSGTPSLPDGFTVREGEDVIVAEVFFDYQPQFISIFASDGVVGQLAFRRPRLGMLNTLN